MPLVFVHGIKTREGDEYRGKVQARDELFRTITFARGTQDPGDLRVLNPYWGGSGANFDFGHASYDAFVKQVPDLVRHRFERMADYHREIQIFRLHAVECRFEQSFRVSTFERHQKAHVLDLFVQLHGGGVVHALVEPDCPVVAGLLSAKGFVGTRSRRVSSKSLVRESCPGALARASGSNRPTRRSIFGPIFGPIIVGHGA